MRPRLIAAFGSRQERYSSAAKLQSYSGIAPVTEQSGNTKWVHFRRACPKFLRPTFHEFAGHSITRSKWARAYYDLQVHEKKKGYHAAVRALAAKWIRVTFRCWKDGKPYDEQTYLQALAKHHSPLYGLLEPATKVGWTTVAGFQKLSVENS